MAQHDKLIAFLKNIALMNILIVFVMVCIVVFGAYLLAFFINLSNQLFGHPAPGIVFMIMLCVGIPVAYLSIKKW